MNDIQIFQNNQFGQIRVATDESGEPLFAGMDVATILGYSNPRDAIARHCKSRGVVKHDTPINGVNQSLTFINEANLYRLVLKSNMPDAEKVQDWVCEEVLPSIRKHGAYLSPQKIEEIMTNPDTIIRLATDLKAEQTKRIAAEKQVAVLTPKAQFLDKVFDADEKIDIGQAAKILELPFGRNTLFKKLREKGVFFKNRNEPKQEYVDRKYFQLKEKWVDRNSHDGFVVVKVLVTQSGLAFLEKLFKDDETSKRLAPII